MIKITVKGLDAFTKAFEEAEQKEIDRTMKALKADLAKATPVDTGEAQSGWYITSNSIRNDVDHIGSLNKGSSQQAPAHFIERTVLAHGNVKPNGIIVREG